MSRPAKATCLLLGVASILLFSLLGRLSWPPFINPSPAETADCGSYNEAIQVAQESARDFLISTEADSVAIDLDVTATLFKRTGIWTVKGFATSGDAHKFHWVVILAYHPGGALSDRWEIVTVVARPLDKDFRKLTQDSSRSFQGEPPSLDAVAALGIALRI